MKRLSCTSCGNPDLEEADGQWRCLYCGSRFVPPPTESSRTSTTIDLAADVAALLQKCRDDPANRRRYANLVLDLDPTNREAQRYL